MKQIIYLLVSCIVIFSIHMVAEKKSPNNVNFVVGIGASADGIPTLEKLFEQLPANTNMSFVVIQHMSPTHESILDQIIQRKTGMKLLKTITLAAKCSDTLCKKQKQSI